MEKICVTRRYSQVQDQGQGGPRSPIGPISQSENNADSVEDESWQITAAFFLRR